MTTQTKCPTCLTVYSIQDSVIGKTVNCRSCNTAFAAQPAARTAGGSGSAPALVSDSSAGGLIGGRYQELSVLGDGTFGKVVKAFDRHLKREVAVKLLKPAALASVEAVQRFEREADVMAAMRHPNVLPIYDKGEHAGGRYLVCMLVNGNSVDKLIPVGGWKDPREAVGHAITLCRTLQDVYSKHGVLHRDIKPANMLIEDGHLFLADFGMAGFRGQSALGSDTPGDEQRLKTLANVTIGTPAYMPPEQAIYDPDKVGPWSDVYGVGAVLYHLLTGRLPIPGLKSLMDILQVIPDPPSRIRSALDPALDPIILKALAKPPQDRYQTGQQFADALARWRDGTAGGPVLAGTPLAVPLPPRRAEPVAPIKPKAKPLPDDEPEDTPPPRRSKRPADDPPPRRSKTARRDKDEDDEDEDAPPPHRKLLLWGLIGLAALLVLGCGIGGMAMALNVGKPTVSTKGGR